MKGKINAACIVLAASLAGCSGPQQPLPQSHASTPTQKPRAPIREIVGISLFSSPPPNRCGASPEVHPCWTMLFVDRSKRPKQAPADGDYEIQVAETSVPEQTNTWLDITAMNGVIHSVELTTSLPPERAVPLLVEKYGVADSNQPGERGGQVVRWVGGDAELIFYPHLNKLGEHRIILRSYDLTKKEREEREARSSKSF